VALEIVKDKQNNHQTYISINELCDIIQGTAAIM
jgi:hypothetical protein